MGIRENPDAGLEPDDFAGSSRNPEAERGVPVLGFDVDRPVVRDHDLLDDVEAEPEAFGAGRGGAAAGTDRRSWAAARGGMVPALLTSTRTCPAAVPSRTHFDRTIGVAVLQRVANQVRGDLRQAVGVPLPGEVAVGSDDRCGGPGKSPDAPAPRAGSAPRDPPARACSGMPPARRARARSSMSSIIRLMRLAARDHLRGRGPRPRSSCALQLQQLRAGQDGVERVAQVVAEHGGEHLVQAQRLGAVVELAARAAASADRAGRTRPPCCAGCAARSACTGSRPRRSRSP